VGDGMDGMPNPPGKQDSAERDALGTWPLRQVKIPGIKAGRAWPPTARSERFEMRRMEELG
jgi:hypothetical protein